MLLHPGVLALIIGSFLTVAMLVYASGLGWRIRRHWDIQSSSARQLALERQTYLVSALVKNSFVFLVLSTFLFIYTAENLHSLFIGAMCATGSLNANPIGWSVLFSKITLFFYPLPG